MRLSRELHPRLSQNDQGEHTKEDIIHWFMQRMDRVPDGAEMKVNIELAFFEESTWSYKDV